MFGERASFVVPVTSGNYAPESITFGVAGSRPIDLLGVTVLAETLPASAAVELWVLKHGGTHGTSADYFHFGDALTSAGGKTWSLASVGGAQIRVKSGGTSGTAAINAWAD